MNVDRLAVTFLWVVAFSTLTGPLLVFRLQKVNDNFLVSAIFCPAKLTRTPVENDAVSSPPSARYSHLSCGNTFLDIAVHVFVVS